MGATPWRFKSSRPHHFKVPGQLDKTSWPDLFLHPPDANKAQMISRSQRGWAQSPTPLPALSRPCSPRVSPTRSLVGLRRCAYRAKTCIVASFVAMCTVFQPFATINLRTSAVFAHSTYAYRAKSRIVASFQPFYAREGEADRMLELTNDGRRRARQLRTHQSASRAIALILSAASADDFSL